MEIQESNRKSRFSRASRISSLCSPEKLSERRHSLSNKASFIEAMELEFPDNQYRGSGFISNEDMRFSGKEVSNRFSNSEYSFLPEMQEKDLNRKSNYAIKHECTCNERQCEGVHCSCFLTPREICMIGYCCPTCIQAKNNFLMTARGWVAQRQKQRGQIQLDEQFLELIRQKNHKNMHYIKQAYGNQPGVKNLVFCTCKKSHCQKKYCLCYERGAKCGEYCSCEECENKEQLPDFDDKEEEKRWERYAVYKPYEQQERAVDPDIQKFIEQQLKQQQFDETMQFDPPNFEKMCRE